MMKRKIKGRDGDRTLGDLSQNTHFRHFEVDGRLRVMKRLLTTRPIFLRHGRCTIYAGNTPELDRR